MKNVRTFIIMALICFGCPMIAEFVGQADDLPDVPVAAAYTPTPAEEADIAARVQQTRDLSQKITPLKSKSSESWTTKAQRRLSAARDSFTSAFSAVKDHANTLTSKAQEHANTLTEKFNSFVSKAKATYRYIQAHRLIEQATAKIKLSDDIFNDPQKFIDQLNYINPELKNHIAQTNLQDRIELANEIIQRYLKKTWLTFSKASFEPSAHAPVTIEDQQAQEDVLLSFPTKLQAAELQARIAQFCSLQPSEAVVQNVTQPHPMTGDSVPAYPFIKFVATASLTGTAAPAPAPLPVEIDSNDL